MFAACLTQAGEASYAVVGEQPFPTISGIGAVMIGRRRKKFTLMPLIALGALSLAVTVPVLSAATIHAATPVRFLTVTVRPGDNVWSLAERRAPKGADIQSIVDDIIVINHIGTTGIVPGQRVRIPE